MRARSGLHKERGGLLGQYSADLGQCISRHRSERALRAAALDQAVANRAKSEFLANMSHELRTPLNAIIGFSEMIEHFAAADSDKAVEYAQLISRAGHHLLNIVTDILDISKIESGTFTLDLEPTSFTSLIRAGIELVRPRIAEKGQSLNVRLPPDLPEVLADGRRLKQVIINILSNAHKFTPEGGRIIVTAAAREDGTVIVAVQDSGVGMDEEQLAIALRPFGQVKAAHVRGHEGTGLGLPISKSLIEQHGGRFVITSRPDAGTTVAFTLPIYRPAADPRSS